MTIIRAYGQLRTTQNEWFIRPFMKNLFATNNALQYTSCSLEFQAQYVSATPDPVCQEQKQDHCNDQTSSWHPDQPRHQSHGLMADMDHLSML